MMLKNYWIAMLLLLPSFSMARERDWSQAADVSKIVAMAKEQAGRSTLSTLYARRFALEDSRDKLARNIEAQQEGIRYNIAGLRFLVAKYTVEGYTVSPDIAAMTDQQVADAISLGWSAPYTPFVFQMVKDNLSPPYLNEPESAIAKSLKPIVTTKRELADIERSLKEVNAEIAKHAK
jgi:hypothetical protein